MTIQAGENMEKLVRCDGCGRVAEGDEADRWISVDGMRSEGGSPFRKCEACDAKVNDWLRSVGLLDENKKKGKT